MERQRVLRSCRSSKARFVKKKYASYPPSLSLSCSWGREEEKRSLLREVQPVHPYAGESYHLSSSFPPPQTPRHASRLCAFSRHSRMWEPSIKRPRLDAQRGSGPSKRASSSLQEMMDKEADRLRKNREQVPELLQRADTLKKTARSMSTCRHLVRHAKDLVAEADELYEEARVRQSRYREVRFNLTRAAYVTLEKSMFDDADASVRACKERGHGMGMDASAAGTGVSANSSRWRVRPEKVEDEGPKEAGDDKDTIITAPGTEVCTQDTVTKLARSRNALRSSLVHEYATTSGCVAKLQPRPEDACPFCHVPMLLQHVKSVLVCRECGYAVAYLDNTTSNISYTDEYEFSSFAYKRISHFDDTLKQVQGKETYTLPDALVTQVVAEFVKQRVPKHAITQNKIRVVLKALRLRRAYDHVSQLYTRITGRKAPRITFEQEEMCRNMFVRMQPPFESICPKDRSAFSPRATCTPFPRRTQGIASTRVRALRRSPSTREALYKFVRLVEISRSQQEKLSLLQLRLVPMFPHPWVAPHAPHVLAPERTRQADGPGTKRTCQEQGGRCCAGHTTSIGQDCHLSLSRSSSLSLSHFTPPCLRSTIRSCLALGPGRNVLQDL